MVEDDVSQMSLDFFDCSFDNCVLFMRVRMDCQMVDSEVICYFVDDGVDVFGPIV